MPVPETTSAEAFARYVGEKVLRVGRGKPWREFQAWTMALPRVVDLLPLASVGEPFLAWTMSGEVEFQEREGNPQHDRLDSLTTYLEKFAHDYLRAGGKRCRLDLPEQVPQWPLTAEVRHNQYAPALAGDWGPVRNPDRAGRGHQGGLCGAGELVIETDD
jgi:hypothetical protein